MVPSFRSGNKPEEILTLLDSGKRGAVIANATDMKSPSDRKASVQLEIGMLAKLGIKGEEVDLRQYFGKQEELAETVSDYDFIWVRGGNVFLLRQAYRLSGFDKIITKLLRDDKIAYGGYSAGICILTPTLRGLELVDPIDAIADGYDSNIIWDGLNLIQYSIAPHYKSDHPESDDINKCVEYFVDNHMLFKTLRDGEAIVVNGPTEKIVG